MIKPAQSRMGRAALGWSVRELAEKSGVSKDTISSYENGKDAKVSTVELLQTALENGGVEFIPENGGGAGVRLKKGAFNG